MDAVPSGGWRAKCIHEFGLLEFSSLYTPAQLPSAVREASDATDEEWKAYYAERIKHKGYSIIEDDEGVEDDEDDEDDDDEADEEEADNAIRKQVVKRVGKLLSSGDYSALLGLERHVYVIGPVDSTWEDVDDLRSCELRAIVYSPFALPRHVDLFLGYHKRARHYSCEFHFHITFDLGSGARKFAEPQQAALAKMWLTDAGEWSMPERPMTEHGEVLCANGYDDPPQSGLNDDDDMQLWTEVEMIEVGNYTPATVRRLRSWLLANCARAGSHKLVSDLALMKLLLAAAGTGSSHVEEGYSWPGCRTHQAVLQQLEADGVLEELATKEHVPHTSWLDYQTRLAAQALTPLDAYYSPYDVQEAHAEWGKRVLEAVEEQGLDKDEDEDDEDEDEDVHTEGGDEKRKAAALYKVPHLVWQLAKEGSLPWSGSMGGMGGMGGMDAQKMMALMRMMGAT